MFTIIRVQPRAPHGFAPTGTSPATLPASTAPPICAGDSVSPALWVASPAAAGALSRTSRSLRTNAPTALGASAAGVFSTSPTIAEPTTAASAKPPTVRTCAAVETPKPSAMGSSVKRPPPPPPPPPRGAPPAAPRLGASPALYHHDRTLRTVAEQVARVVRGRAANPAWLAGMMRHGYAGGAEMARAVDALAAFAPTLPERFDRQFDLLHAAMLGTPEVAAFLRRENPAAHDAIRARFAAMQAAGHWHPRRNAVAA